MHPGWGSQRRGCQAWPALIRSAAGTQGGTHGCSAGHAVRVRGLVLLPLRARRLLHHRTERARGGHHLRAGPAPGRGHHARRSRLAVPAAGGGRALRLPAGARGRAGLLLEVSVAAGAQGGRGDRDGLDRLRPRVPRRQPGRAGARGRHQGPAQHGPDRPTALHRLRAQPVRLPVRRQEPGLTRDGLLRLDPARRRPPTWAPPRASRSTTCARTCATSTSAWTPSAPRRRHATASRSTPR